MHFATIINICTLAIAFGMAWTLHAFAGGFGYGDYEEDMQQITSAIKAECKASGIGPATDKHQFRKACGLAVRGEKVIGFEDRIFYTRDYHKEGFLDVLGIERQITGANGEVYSLVRSLNTQVSRSHEQPETSTSHADATLFVKRQHGWQQVWRFVNPHTDDWPKKWNRANPLFPEQQNLTPQVATMIDRLWREVVVMGTAKLAFNIKDATGPVFMARNPKVRQ